MQVQIEDQKDVLNVKVVHGDGPSLIGRELLRKTVFPWHKIFKINAESVITSPVLFSKEMQHKFPDVFNGKLGKYLVYKCHCQ